MDTLKNFINWLNKKITTQLSFYVIIYVGDNMIKRISSHSELWKNDIIKEILDYVEEKCEGINGEAYIGYPIFNDKYNNKIFNIDLAMVTNKGLFIVNFVNEVIINYADVQDQIYNKMENKLKKYPFLLSRRNLFFEINIVTFATAEIEKEDNYPLVKNKQDFVAYINSIDENYDENEIKNMIAGIQESYGINNRFVREGISEDSKGMLINKMNDKIEVHDSSQMNAVFNDPKGIQRIRGMAGSGKTIVLARKAVELHTLHPDWTIVVTYQTRSLKDQFINLINKFYSIKNDGDLPNYDKLKVMHAWGASTSTGLYYEICLNNAIVPLSYKEARYIYGREHTFSKLCKNVLEENKKFTKMYDCILIDEAQDFDKNFLQLCLKVLDKNERLVYAYDELQNLNELSLLDPMEIFGKHVEHDTPLKTCYRNQGNVIVTAHALGMGLYRKEGLLQLPSSFDVWESIGYVSDEKIEPGKKTILYRTSETSPDMLGASAEELIKFSNYEDKKTMFSELLDKINKNLSNDCLDVKDIMIIDMDAIEANDNSQILISLLNEKNFNFSIHRAGSTNPEDFFREDSVVYTSIYRAKGNESFYVYVINAQKCVGALSKIKERNALFTAITRSKGWVRVLGIGEDMVSLIDEYNKIKENEFKLVFEKYPTKEEQENILLNNADIDEPDQMTLDNARKVIGKLKDKIPTEDIVKELLGPDYIEIIKGMTINKEEKDVQE